MLDGMYHVEILTCCTEQTKATGRKVAKNARICTETCIKTHGLIHAFYLSKNHEFKFFKSM